MGEYTAGYSWSSHTAYKLTTHNCQDFAQSFRSLLGCEPVPYQYLKLKNTLRNPVGAVVGGILEIKPLGTETIGDKLNWVRWKVGLPRGGRKGGRASDESCEAKEP